MLQRGCHILIATPGRLLDFVERGKVKFNDIRIIVLDEADRMLDMGFLPVVETMMKNSSMPSHEKRQTLMFSATFPDEIQRLAGQFLDKYIFIAVGIIGKLHTTFRRLHIFIILISKQEEHVLMLNKTYLKWLNLINVRNY